MNDILEDPLGPVGPVAPASREVVRLVTSCWSDKRGLHVRKDLLVLKKQSYGYQLLEEDSANISAGEVAKNITNLNECKDGVYIVTMCNERHDFETGYIDDYDYRLVPYDNPPAEGIEHKRV